MGTELAGFASEPATASASKPKLRPGFGKTRVRQEWPLRSPFLAVSALVVGTKQYVIVQIG
jgi:hypothetical protein